MSNHNTGFDIDLIIIILDILHFEITLSLQSSTLLLCVPAALKNTLTVIFLPQFLNFNDPRKNTNKKIVGK